MKHFATLVALAFAMMLAASGPARAADVLALHSFSTTLSVNVPAVVPFGCPYCPVGLTLSSVSWEEIEQAQEFFQAHFGEGRLRHFPADRQCIIINPLLQGLQAVGGQRGAHLVPSGYVLFKGGQVYHRGEPRQDGRHGRC
jgi:hypothetical protein